MSEREELARVLDRHRPLTPRQLPPLLVSGCTCGWGSEVYSHTAHLTQEVTSARAAHDDRIRAESLAPGSQAIQRRMSEREDDAALVRLADHLKPSLRDRLRELLDADAAAHEVIDLRSRCQRAEDLAAECRRQLRSRDRQCDQLAAEVAALRVAAGTPTHHTTEEDT